jgi:hypothetical protein
MLILAFITSILVFCIADILISTIALSIYTIIVGLFQKKIKGYSDANVHSLNQFLGAVLGVSIASYIGYSLAIGISVDINLKLLFGIYCSIYYLLNFYTKGAIKPWAQKAGAIVGFSISYILFTNN